MVDGFLNFDTKINQKGFTKGLNSIKNGLAKFKNTIVSVAKVAEKAFGDNELKDAYNVQAQAEAKLETVMRQRMGATSETIQQIKELASEQQKLGIIGDEVQLAGAQQVATFLNESDSLKTLIPAMNNLLAQQKGVNASTEDATSIANLFGKAMQGQTSALTRVGITFTEAEEQVLKYGTESERAAMLAQVVTNNVGEMNTALAQTDAGKQKQLANSMGDVKEQFGQAISQITTVFVPVLARAVSMLSAFASQVQQIAKVIANAFGEELGSTTAVSESIAQGVSAQESLTEAVGDTAEENEKSLAGFDKITKLTDNASDNTSDTSARLSVPSLDTGDATESVKEYGSVLEILKDKLKSVVDFFSGIDFVGITTSFVEKINGIFAAINWGYIGSTLSSAVKGVLEILTAAFLTFDFFALGADFAELINGIDWVGIFSSWAALASAEAVAALDTLLGFVKTLDWTKLGKDLWDSLVGVVTSVDWGGIISKAFKLLGSAVAGAGNLIVAFVSELIMAVSTALTTYFDPFIEEAGGNVILGLYNGIVNAAKNMIGWIYDNIVKPFIDGFKSLFGIRSPSTVMAELGGYLISGLVNGVKGIAGKVKQVFLDILEDIKGIFANIGSFFSEKFSGAFKKVKEAFSGTRDFFAEKFADIWSVFKNIPGKFTSWFGQAWQNVKKAFSNVGSFFGGIWETIKEKFTNIGQKVGESISEAFKTAVNALLSAAETVLNAPIKAINTAIGALNEVLGVDISKIDTFDLPRLATGTVVPANAGEFAAILGDNKREAEVVSPLSTIRQAVSEALAQAKGESDTVTIILQLDGKQIYKTVVDQNNRQKRKTGTNPLAT